MNKETAKKNRFKLPLVTAVTTLIYTGFVNVSLADEAQALKNAGIKSTDINATDNGFFSELTNLVYIVMGVGGLWTVTWLIIGGMLLGGSGSNPQKRNGGIAAIMTACLGIFVIYKAFTIAGWAANIAGV